MHLHMFLIHIVYMMNYQVYQRSDLQDNYYILNYLYYQHMFQQHIKYI